MIGRSRGQDEERGDGRPGHGGLSAPYLPHLPLQGAGEAPSLSNTLPSADGSQCSQSPCSQVAWCPELNRDVGFQLRLRGEEERVGLQWRDFTLQGKASEGTGERTQDSGFSGSLARSPESPSCSEGGEERTARKSGGRSRLPSTTRSGDAVTNTRVALAKALVGSSLALSRGRSLALGREVREEEARCRREELELLEERAWKYHYCWETGEVEATGLECQGRGMAALAGADEDSFGDSDRYDIRYHDSDNSGGSTSKDGADIDKTGGSTCKGSADSGGIGGSTSKVGAVSDWIGGSTAGVTSSDGIPAQNNSFSEKSVNSTVSIGGADSHSSGGSTSKGGANSDSSDSDSDSSNSDSDTDSNSSSRSTSKDVAASDGIGGSNTDVTTAKGVSDQNNSDKSATSTAGVFTTQVCIASAFSGGSTSSHIKVSKARKRLRPVDPAPSCEYERIRARNIAERRAGLARLEAGKEGLANLEAGGEGPARLEAGKEGLTRLEAGEEGLARLEAGEEGLTRLEAEGEGLARLEAGGEGLARLEAGEEGLARLEAGEEGLARLEAGGEGQLLGCW